MTVSDLVSELIKWTESGYVDREVWTQLSSRISASALPDNLEALQFPPTPEPQPTQRAFMVNITVSTCPLSTVGQKCQMRCFTKTPHDLNGKMLMPSITSVHWDQRFFLL